MADPLPMLTIFDKQIQLRMGQANVKRWVDDIMPLLMDGDPLGVEGFASHRVPLDEAPEAYAKFQRKETASKVRSRPVVAVRFGGDLGAGLRLRGGADLECVGHPPQQLPQLLALGLAEAGEHVLLAGSDRGVGVGQQPLPVDGQLDHVAAAVGLVAVALDQPAAI